MKQDIIEPIKVNFNREEFFLEFKNLSIEHDKLKIDNYFYIRTIQDESDEGFLILYVTDLCNKNCSYCFNKKNISLKNSGITYDIIDLIEFIKNNNIKSIRFFGGEPLLRMDIIKEFIKTFKKNKIDLNYEIFTNGTLLNLDTINFLKQNKFEVYISLPGSINEKQDLTSILNNIDLLIESNIRVFGRMVWNIRDSVTLKELISYIFETKIKMVSVTIEWGKKIDSKDLEVIESNLISLANWYIDNIKNRNYNYVGIHPFSAYIFKWLSKNYDEISCGAGINVFSISTNGNIYPCHCFNENKEFYSGNILDNNLNKLFLNENVINNDCLLCEYKYYCKSKCYANNYYMNNNIRLVYKEKCKVEKLFINCSAYIIKKIKDLGETEWKRYSKLIARGGIFYENSK